MRLLSLLAFAVAGLFLAETLAVAATTPPDTDLAQAARAQEARVRRIQDQLHPLFGDVEVPGANAVLHLGRDYYFLPANEARLVITEGWGNPPATADGVLGMVFPAGKTFTDDIWGAVVTYEASGYVSDSDAASTNFDALLDSLRGDEAQINAERTQQGFPATHLVGWAQRPAYDVRTHSVVWARNIQFSGESENTLNYDIRLLGRRGVLSLNMVTVMAQLGETREAARQLAGAAEFAPGARYADFQEGTDRVAEYGIAGMIAAGVGVTLAKKAGLLALILAFGKKGIVLVLAAIALLWRRIRRLFGGGGDAPAASYRETPPARDV